MRLGVERGCAGVPGRGKGMGGYALACTHNTPPHASMVKHAPDEVGVSVRGMACLNGTREAQGGKRGRGDESRSL